MLMRGWGGISHIPLHCGEILLQLDELVAVKNWSCSVLTAYVTPCSILLLLALHKNFKKIIARDAINK